MVSLWTGPDENIEVVRLTKLDEIEQLISLFENVAAVENWQPNGALRQYQTRSVYFALRAQGEIIGGLQLVLPDGSGFLPSQQVWPEVSLPAPSYHHAHIAVLALNEASRGQALLFWRLVVEVWRYCVAKGIASLVIEVTPRVLPIYRRLGWPLLTVGALRTHWGEDCHLCTLGVPDVAATLLRRAEHSQFYRQIVAQAFRVALTPQPLKPAPQPLVREATAIYAAA